MGLFGFKIIRQKGVSVLSRRELTEKVEDLLTRMTKVEGNRKFKAIEDVNEAKSQDEINAILAQGTTQFIP